MSKPLIIRTDELDDESASWVSQHADLAHVEVDSPEFQKFADEAAGLLVRTATTVDEALLERMPRLKVVGRGGVGIDNIDVGACQARGVRVVYTPEASTQAVVEYTLAAMLDMVRPRIVLDEPVDRTEWASLRAEIVGFHQLNELSIGILGMGRIGSRLAGALGSLGCTMNYCDLREIPAQDRHGATPLPIEGLFAESDVISIHVDGRSANRRLVNESLLQNASSSLLLVNTSRGRVIAEDDLADWLQANPLAAVLLDVQEQEPPDPANPLWELDNCFIAPHLASRTRTSLANMGRVVQDVVAVIQDEQPTWQADPSDPALA